MHHPSFYIYEKTDACFISGHCFANNDSNPSDWCQQCFPQLSNASWSERIGKQNCIMHGCTGREVTF
jgi:hypothetical protein